MRIARQTDLDQTLAQSVLRDNISNSGAETADIQMVFDGNNAVLALFDGLNDGRVGERLESGNVHMLYGNALFLQNRGSAHGFLGADGGGQQKDVIAFAQHAGTIELHRLICREQTRNFLAEHADVDRTVVVVCQIEHAFDFGRITDVEDGHVRHGTQYADIVDGLVGNTARRGNARHKADEYDRQIRVSDAHFQLIENAAIQEYRKGVQERTVALTAHAGCPGAHVLLGDTHGQVAVRVGLAELFYFAGGAEVGRHNQNLRMLGCEADHIFFMCINFDLHFELLPSHISS